MRSSCAIHGESKFHNQFTAMKYSDEPPKKKKFSNRAFLFCLYYLENIRKCARAVIHHSCAWHRLLYHLSFGRNNAQTHTKMHKSVSKSMSIKMINLNSRDLKRLGNFDSVIVDYMRNSCCTNAILFCKFIAFHPRSGIKTDLLSDFRRKAFIWIAVIGIIIAKVIFNL